jgi:hypothetical protein
LVVVGGGERRRTEGERGRGRDDGLRGVERASARDPARSRRTKKKKKGRATHAEQPWMEHDCTRRWSAPGPVKSARASISGAAFLAAAPSPPLMAAEETGGEEARRRRAAAAVPVDATGGGASGDDKSGRRGREDAAAAVYRRARSRWRARRQLMWCQGAKTQPEAGEPTMMSRVLCVSSCGCRVALERGKAC